MAILLGSVATSLCAREIVTRSAAQGVTASANVIAQVQRYAALADAGASEALVLELQRLVTDNAAPALERGERVDELAVICADRLHDAELYRLVLGHADAAIALDMVGRVSRALDADSATAVPRRRRHRSFRAGDRRYALRRAKYAQSKSANALSRMTGQLPTSAYGVSPVRGCTVPVNTPG